MGFAEFLAKVKGKRVLILVHAGADVDALASAAALSLALKGKVKPSIGVPDHINLEAKQLAHSLEVEFHTNPKLDKFEGIFLLDLNSFDLLGSMAEEVRHYKMPIFVLDHHAKSKKPIAPKNFTLIDEKAVSTTELVFKLIKKHKLPLTNKTAALIGCGIITDTAHFRTADHETFALMAEVMRKSGKSFVELEDLFRVKKDFSEKIAKLKAAKRLRIFKAGPYLIAGSEVGSFEANAASLFVKTGADVAFVGNEEKNELKISGRAHHQLINELDFDLAKHVFQPLSESMPGSEGGGHPGAAAFNLKNPHKSYDDALMDCVKLSFEFIKKKNPQAQLKEYK